LGWVLGEGSFESFSEGSPTVQQAEEGLLVEPLLRVRPAGEHLFHLRPSRPPVDPVDGYGFNKMRV